MLRFKRCIICYLGIIGSLVLLMNSAQAATTTLLDPATLAIGTKVGENLQVFGVCPASNKNCLPEEKVKYVSAIAGRVGKIEFDVNITDDFELDVNAYFDYSGDRETITLFKKEDDNSGALFIRYIGWNIDFNDDYRSNNANTVGWNDKSINNIELLGKSGVAYLNINGVPFKDSSGNEGNTFKLDTSKPFIKLVITNIQPSDQLYEITLKGGNSTTPTTPTTPTVPTTPVTTTSSSSSDSCASECKLEIVGLDVPCVLVPIASVCSGAQVAVYSVQMQQHSGNFTFDLDLGSVKQRMMLTPIKQYNLGNQACTDIRVDTFDDSGLIITSSENKTTCK